ncbi:MAG: response regulator transcription factor [Pseudomonadota bacterium]
MHATSSMSQVYAPSARGEEELRGGNTSIPVAQLDMLVRFDGQLPLARVRASMPRVAPQEFTALFHALRDGGLLVPKEASPCHRRPGDGYCLAMARARAGRAAAGARTLDIVVVEDEPVLASFIKIYLSLDGARIRLAGSRAEASAELGKQPVPDLILLDAVLPDADGFDILRWMRRHAALKDVPVIMLTGRTTREWVLQGIASGADGYVTKPFLPESLIRAARTCLGLAPAPSEADPWAHSLACRPPVAAA